MDSQTNTSLNHVLGALRAHEGELKRLGVLHAAVFGSVARGEDTPESDVDILVTLDDEKVRTLFDYAGIAADIKEWVGREIELAEKTHLRPEISPMVLSEAVDAF